jgi:DNA-binding transcriptional MerR regulator
MKLFDISKVSAMSGVAPSALRYYEAVGLIESAGRRSLRRQFGPEALLQLSLIRMGQAAGFSLDEIRGMFGKDGRADVPRPDLRAKAAELDHNPQAHRPSQRAFACRRVSCAIPSRLSEISTLDADCRPRQTCCSEAPPVASVLSRIASNHGHLQGQFTPPPAMRSRG